MNAGILSGPRRLDRDDDRSQFCSGAYELDSWLWKFAWENQRASDAATYVVVRDREVLGYYSMSISAYATRELPTGADDDGPRLTPCILLTRLAVDQNAQGMGIGAGLLRHAIVQSYELSGIVNASVLLLHCRDADAKSFYLANGNFLQSPVEPMHLMLSVGEMRRGLDF